MLFHAIRQKLFPASSNGASALLSEPALRKLLGLFFIAMMLPIGALVWHAYNQLKWESFHRYRTYAEDLTTRIDQNLAELVDLEQNRSIEEFNFFNEGSVSPDVDRLKNTLSRSPLSVRSPDGEASGVLGYFQVDEQGGFTSPLLPNGKLPDEQDDVSDPGLINDLAGIDGAELRTRELGADRLRMVLIENRLIESTSAPDAHLSSLATGQNNSGDDTKTEQTDAVSPAVSSTESVKEAGLAVDTEDESSTSGSSVGQETREAANSVNTSRRSGFDRLIESVTGQSSKLAKERAPTNPETQALEEASAPETVRQNVSRLNLDSSLEAKSQLYESRQKKSDLGRQATLTVPVTDKPLEPSGSASSISDVAMDSASTANINLSNGERFEPTRKRSLIQDIGPYEFALLGSGHFILFRSIWNQDKRLVQGLLFGQDDLLVSEFLSLFRNSLLDEIATMIIAFDDEVVLSFNEEAQIRSGSSESIIDGSVLYRRHLTSPFGKMQIVYIVKELPPGPGATVLAGVTAALLLVLCGGFYLLYRAALKQINLARQQQNFVSSISHELKTPLTSIRMYSEMLKSGWASKDKQQDYFTYINNESERLTRLINNVLRLSSISHSDLRLELTDLSVSQLIDVLRSKIEGQLASTSTEIRYNIDSDLESERVRVDEDAFVQIMINLIDNAVKFSKNSDQNVIELGCDRAEGKTLAFSIRDFGPGIPKNQLEKIFELFYRSEDELTRETVGTGIGLAIVDQLTRLMGGSVSVINVDPGAKFRVCLPVV